MKQIICLAFLIAIISACNSGGDSPAVAESVDTQGYVMEQISGSSWVRAIKMDSGGNLMEEGFLENGVKQGTWVTFKPGNEFPQEVTSYVNGVYHGNYMKFNERGQLELKASYKNNKLHGPWGRYRFGRPETTANYRDGELDGVYKEYYNRDGKLQKEIHYKMGVQHGPYRFYNEEGAITLEYEYKDGEQVGGGIIESDKPNEPK